MKLVKSLLLGSAAGLVAVGGVQAADLPVKKAAPVEYVRICSAYGAGFFYIPGTDTCLRVSGRVRAEYQYIDPLTRASDAIGWRGRARLNFDARTQTSYGTLRAFFRYELTRNSGNYSVFGQTVTNQVISTDINKAFIQFAGITAGRAQSFFDFYADDVNFGGLPTGSDSYAFDPVVLAYTASFGSGFSATLSLEDPAARRFQSFAGTQLLPNGILYAGQRMPEIVGALRVDQAWGSAQISGALHQLNALNRLPPGVAPAPYVDTEYGFAIQGGLKVNLPQIAPGDVLWLQAAYSEGAVNYLGIGGPYGGGSVRQGGAFGGVSNNELLLTSADAFVNGVGDLKRTRGGVATAAFLHYWSPQWRQAVFGTYGRLDYSASVENPVIAAGLPGAGARAFGSVVDTTWWQIGSNLIWSPVRDLDIGLEVLYRVIDPRGRVVAGTVTPAGTVVKTVGQDDAIQARFRIQRDF